MAAELERHLRNAIKNGTDQDGVKQVGSGVYAVSPAIVNPYLLKSCAQCGTSLETCRTCSQCGDVRYCSKACQTTSWKSIHKLYCKHHKEASVGKLTWDNLFAARDFSQLTVTMREHEGLGQLIESALGQVILSNHQLVQNAKLVDIKSMARVASRRLNRKDPTDQAAGLLTIAAAMSTIASPQVDDALSQTPLFRCIARFYLAHAPRMPATQSLEGTMDIPLLSAMVNLVHPQAALKAGKDLMTRCVDTTWDTIEACCTALAEETNKNPGTTNTTSKGATNQKREFHRIIQDYQFDSKSTEIADFLTSPETQERGITGSTVAFAEKFGTTHEEALLFLEWINIGVFATAGGSKEATDDELGQREFLATRHAAAPEEIYATHRSSLKDGILPNLRMLARNLAYVGASPSPRVAAQMQRIVVADFVHGIYDLDHNAIQVWATTAQNMVECFSNNTCTTEESKQMADIGNAIFNVLTVCAKQKLGGVEIVFRNEKPPQGEGYWGVEERPMR